MKSFLFITTLTPENLLSPLRESLFTLYLEALKAQSYKNWSAILIGEHDKFDGNIRYLKTDAVSKTDKLGIAYEYILKLELKPDYIIRLDDDDLISPVVLEHASSIDFDCYSDLYHTFYDLTSSLTSQQKRNWLPNTVIHKYEHAVALYGKDNLPLFMHSHNIAWHLFYSRKKIVFAEKKHPVYLRILSPTTITSKVGLNKQADISDIDMVEFKRYLKLFGKWSSFDCRDFDLFKDKLRHIWENFSKQAIREEKFFFDFLKRKK